MSDDGLFKGMVAATLLTLIFIFWPLAIAWSFNHLFGLDLEYSIKTWLAIIVLTTVFAFRPKAGVVDGMKGE